jgi:hypothetical protein
MKPRNFDEYMADESRVSPADRERIEHEVAVIVDNIKMDLIRELCGVLETIYLIRSPGMVGRVDADLHVKSEDCSLFSSPQAPLPAMGTGQLIVY